MRQERLEKISAAVDQVSDLLIGMVREPNNTQLPWEALRLLGEMRIELSLEAAFGRIGGKLGVEEVQS